MWLSLEGWMARPRFLRGPAASAAGRSWLRGRSQSSFRQSPLHACGGIVRSCCRSLCRKGPCWILSATSRFGKARVCVNTLIRASTEISTFESDFSSWAQDPWVGASAGILVGSRRSFSRNALIVDRVSGRDSAGRKSRSASCTTT